MSNCDCDIEVSDKEQVKTLIVLFGLNITMFFVEIFSGLLWESTSLIADSLDMLADASVYAISWYAVTKNAAIKSQAARLSGYLQILLGLSVLFETCRRFYSGSDPEGIAISSVGTIALLVNILCVILIYRHRKGGVHMQASWIFSKNDVIANLGLILAGVLVVLFNSNLPDLIIAIGISGLVCFGGLQIIKASKTT